jgi:sarcosine/dimethylglycine N-methyltransferase
LRAAGLDPEKRLTPTEIAALDHFHTGGFSASLLLRSLAHVQAAAMLLNRLTGLDDRVAVKVGSALDIPYPSGSFDVVWMPNVGMNIANKQRLYEEVHRVLRPGGRFAFQEMVAGDAVTTCFPLPWASEPAHNSLVTAAEMNAVLGRCGFENIYFADVSEQPLPPPAEGTPEAIPQAPRSLSAYVDDLALKSDNAARSLRERQIRLFRGVFRAK